MLGKKKVEMEKRAGHWLVTGWSDASERVSSLDQVMEHTKEVAQAGRAAAAAVWRHVGGSTKESRDTGWREEQQRENEQTMTALFLMLVMVGLSALGGSGAGSICSSDGNGSSSDGRKKEA